MTEAATVYTNAEVESRMLCALVTDPDDAKRTIFKLDPELFYEKTNQRIFAAIREMYARNKPIDLATLDSELNGECINQIVDIFRNVGRMFLADQYVEILAEAKKRRDLYMFADGIRKDVGDKTVEVDELVGRIRNYSAAFRQNGQEQSVLDALMAAYEEMFNHDVNRFCRTGLECIDKHIGGFEPGTLNIIGARPGVGKSIMGMQILAFNAAKGKRGLLINREMMKKNFMARMVSNVIGLESGVIKHGTVDKDVAGRFMDAVTIIQGLPINVLNNPAKPSEIRGAVIEAMEDGGLDLLVVDYLQRITPDGRFLKRNEAIGSITWALKDIAMTYKIPVVLLSQLNRDADNRRPKNSDLKESGDIEQDADGIILLHEPDPVEVPDEGKALYNQCQKQGTAYIEVIVGKNREGTTGASPIIRDADHMKFIQPQWGDA